MSMRFSCPQKEADFYEEEYKMKIVVAIDSFKGSLSSLQAGNAAKDGIRRALGDCAEVCVIPVADGGEGTVDALADGLGGEIKTVEVSNPLGRKREAKYGMIGKTAVIEIAEAAGIALISKDELNPMNTTTYGVGEIIRDAIRNGCREFIIGIGGSATNDGGTGMLKALGFEFYKENGEVVSQGAKELAKIKYIDDKNVLPELKECKFDIACDVSNPLCGKNGCSEIFAPQKGAKKEDIAFMDEGMKNYATVTAEKYKNADMNFSGAGAAGGMGFAFMAYLGGELQSGIDLILSKNGIEDKIKDADLVITGEGRIDNQTAMGKAPSGIAKIAKKHKKTVVAVSGCVARDVSACNNCGIDAIFPIIRNACSLEEAMDICYAKKNMADCVEQIVRLWNVKNL